MTFSALYALHKIICESYLWMYLYFGSTIRLTCFQWLFRHTFSIKLFINSFLEFILMSLSYEMLNLHFALMVHQISLFQNEIPITPEEKNAFSSIIWAISQMLGRYRVCMNKNQAKVSEIHTFLRPGWGLLQAWLSKALAWTIIFAVHLSCVLIYTSIKPFSSNFMTEFDDT